jgi:hypothetical protein
VQTASATPGCGLPGLSAADTPINMKTTSASSVDLLSKMH